MNTTRELMSSLLHGIARNADARAMEAFRANLLLLKLKRLLPSTFLNGLLERGGGGGGGGNLTVAEVEAALTREERRLDVYFGATATDNAKKPAADQDALLRSNVVR